jgi:integrase
MCVRIIQTICSYADRIGSGCELQIRSAAYVFVNGTGHPRNARNLFRAFYAAMRKAGITRFRFHDLRHTFATRLIQAGIDVFTVQKLGRWKTISMVFRYAHDQPESLRGGAEVLGRLRRENSTIGLGHDWGDGVSA